MRVKLIAAGVLGLLLSSVGFAKLSERLPVSRTYQAFTTVAH